MNRRSGRRVWGHPKVAGSVLAAVLCLSSAGWAEVVLRESDALERAFPGLTTHRRTLYLDKDRVASVEAAAGSKLPSPVVTVFEARSPEGDPAGSACLDTHVVRTMPETVLTVVDGQGRLRAAMVLQFGEPPDYLPRERWLRTFEGRRLDDEFWPGRGIPRVTGSTLTVHALTSAVRRCLALDALVLHGEHGNDSGRGSR